MVSVWEREAYVMERLTKKERKEIAKEILAIQQSGDNRKGITWTLRRLVLRRI
jgi:hypothetical protein